MRLTLLTRAWCHLCDDMLQALTPLAEARGVSVAVIDVDDDPVLAATYSERVPVLFAGDPGAGTELCHYRLDLPRVEAALAASGAPAD